MYRWILAALTCLLSPLSAHSAQAPELISPPYVRTWCFVSTDNMQVFDVSKRSVYFTDISRCGELDAESGKLRWSVRLSGSPSVATVAGGKIYLLVREEKICKIESIGLASHEATVLASSKGEGSSLMIARDALYFIDDNARLTRYALNGSIVWSRQLPGKPQMRFVSSQVVATPGRTLCRVRRMRGSGVRHFHRCDSMVS